MGPKISSHIRRYAGSSVWISVGLDEPAVLAVGAAAGDHLRVLLGVAEVAADAVERLLVDHRAHEVPEVGHVADRMSAIIAAMRSRTSGQSDLGMYTRLAAEHFCPWYS
jgi:hypothetical protein